MKRNAVTLAGLASVVVLALTSCGGTDAHGSETPPLAVVSGQVTAGPTCPVERLDHPCPPKLLIATVRATVGSQVAASTTSAGDGRYRLTLPTGVYTISADPAAALARCTPKQVKVVAPAALAVGIVCDTGIR